MKFARNTIFSFILKYLNLRSYFEKMWISLSVDESVGSVRSDDRVELRNYQANIQALNSFCRHNYEINI